MPPGYDLILEGDGDIWRITATPQNGQRTFDYDAAGDHFRRRKLSRAIRSPGASSRWARRSTRWRSVSTTAPIPQWTPQNPGHSEAKARAGDVLRHRRAGQPRFRDRQARIPAKATRSAITPTRIRASNDISRRRNWRFELNLTERLLESTLGVKTLLFRPPYGIDHQPETASEVADAAHSAIDGLYHRRRAHRSARLGRAGRRSRRRPPTRSSSAFSTEARTARRWQHHPAARRRRRSQPHGRGAAADHRRPARRRASSSFPSPTCSARRARR